MFQTIIVFSIVNFRPLIYLSYTIGDYEYPDWANGVGWLIAVSSMVMIPGWAVYYLLTVPGTLKQVRIKQYWIRWWWWISQTVDLKHEKVCKMWTSFTINVYWKLCILYAMKFKMMMEYYFHNIKIKMYYWMCCYRGLLSGYHQSGNTTPYKKVNILFDIR